MDAEPPEKKLKEETTPGNRHEALAFENSQVLAGYGFDCLLEPTKMIQEIPNEIITSLLFFKKPVTDIYRIAKFLLGIEREGRDGYDRFRRRVTVIDRDAKKYKKKKSEEDKYLSFLKDIAFETSFFFPIAEDSEKKISSSFDKNMPIDSANVHESTVVQQSAELRDSEVQTELSCDIDLSNPAKTTPSLLKLHQGCISHCNQLKQKLQTRINTLNHWKNYRMKLSLNAEKSKSSVKKASISKKTFSKILEDKNNKLAAVTIDLKEKKALLQDVLTKLDDVSGIVELKEGKSFSSKTIKAVISLKTLGVADEKVGEVMKVVGELAGVTFDNVPSASTCRNFALSALNLGNAHIKSRLTELLESGESLSLASDETTKGTVKLQSFGVHSSDGSFTCLGVEPVAEKSAKTALNALEFLINELPEAPSDFFKKFLVSVTSTISDSARTEVKFNELLEDSRRKAVPEIVNDYAKLSESEKAGFYKFSQFFCQLHVVSNYSDAVLKTLLDHELIVKKSAKLSEPSVFVLVKLVSQLFGQRGSGLHGILQLWVAWCKTHQVNRFTFPAFVGNRFNIVFVIASRVFFHRHHLVEFAKECECSKPALKEIRELLEDELVVEHLHVFGLCDQLVTGPLWRLAEGCDHIYETCIYSLQLQKWFQDCADFPVTFFGGGSPTPSLQVSSPTNSVLLLQALVSRDPTEMGVEVARLVSDSSLRYFDRAFVDFLPGGKHSNDQDDYREKMESAPATNRNVESVFGLMSHFFDTRPNMRIDVRIALTLLKKNHTLTWLQSLPEGVQDEILKSSRADLNKLRERADSRQLSIETVILRQMKDKNLTAAKKQAKDERDRCKYTQEIICLGFWKTSDEMNQGLAKLKTEKEKKEAICSQLKFRKFVIKQNAPSSSFTVTAKSKPLTVQNLVLKLEKLFDEQQDSQQLLLMDHEYIGQKLFDTRNKTYGFVQDIRLLGAEKSVSVQFDDDANPTLVDFYEFEQHLDSQVFLFQN